MHDENEGVILPPKPLGRFKTMLLGGGFGAAFGVLGAGAWQLISNWSHARKHTFNKAGIAEFAIDVALTSALVSYFIGQGEHEKYDIKVDKAKLEHRVRRLEAEKAELLGSQVKPIHLETKNAIVEMVKDPAFLNIIASGKHVTKEELTKVARAAFERSPAAQALIGHMVTTPGTSQDVQEYLTQLKNVNQNGDLKTCAQQGGSWQEYVSTFENQATLAQR